jgi:hypothetical protein
MRIGALLLALCWTGSARAQKAADLKPPTPTEAVGGILEAFRTHDVIGLSAGADHGDARGPAFVVSLIRDDRFRATDVDVVMEIANARYQSVMDRYTSGNDVEYSELRHVWDDTTQPQVVGRVGEIPEIYRALRDANAGGSHDRQHRAILGDPPIEWENVHTNADFQKWLALRDTHPADAIRREVLAKGRLALVVYGSGHLQRKQQATNYQMDNPLAETLISLLDREGTKTFVIVTVGDGFLPTVTADSWRVPSLARLRGTTLGAEPLAPGSLPRVTLRDGQSIPIPKEQWIALRSEEQFDAVLYLGPPSTRTTIPLSSTICDDPAYLETRLQRMALAGTPQSVADRLKQACSK